MSYSNGLLSDQSYQTANKYVQRGLPGVGFKLTDTGDYDMQNKKLTNVKSGTDSNDAVNKSQLDATTNLLHGSRAGDVVNDKAVIYSNTGAVHANSLYIEDPPDQGNSNEVRIMTEHQSYPNIHLNIPDLHNFDGHGGRPKSELMVTSVEQTVTGKKVFENIEVHDPTSNNQAANKSYADTKLSLTGGTMTGDLILPHHNYPIPGNTNKVINYESQREIFLSRQESFPMQADINMNNNFIQNIATPTSSHQVTNKGYCDYNFLNRQKGGMLMGSLSMNQNDLFEIPAPKYGSSAANKNYVDGEIGKIPSVDTTQFIKKDGSVPMAADLDMNGNKIKNVGTPYTHENDAAVNVGFFNTELNASNSNVYTQITTAYKKYIDEKLLKSHLLSAKVENAFKYLSEVDESSTESNIVIHGIVDFNGSPHKNKKAYDIDMVYSAGSQNYNSKLGINIYPLAIGKYTLVMEYYFPEDLNITIFAQASKPTTIIKKQITVSEPNFKKQLVQFDFPEKANPSYYIYFTIIGSGTTSTNLEGYLVFYGVKGWDDAVPPEIYDHALETGMFEYDNGNMKIYHDIDMNNHRITNLSDGTDKNDAVNMSQLIAVKTQSDKMKSIFDKIRFYLPNYSYLNFFTYRFYDFTKPNKFIISRLSDSHRISGLNPNLFISGSKSITLTQFIPNQGLLFNSSIKIIIALNYSVTQTSPFTMMISMILKDNLKLYFVEPTQENIAYYPVFIIDKKQSQLSMETLANLFRYQPYSSDFNEKQIMVWIGYNYSLNRYEISIGNADKLIFNAPSIPPSAFKTSKIRIDPGKNIIKRICYENSYKSHDEDYLKIVLEEKKNGSHFN